MLGELAEGFLLGWRIFTNPGESLDDSKPVQQTHPGEGPHEVVNVNVGLFCVDIGADLQQVLSNTHIHQSATA